MRVARAVAVDQISGPTACSPSILLAGHKACSVTAVAKEVEKLTFDLRDR